MNKILKNSLLVVFTLGLMSGGAVAHEEHADAHKDPHEEGTHKPDPPSGGGGHKNLSSAATNPIANLVQFQVQNQYTPTETLKPLLNFAHNGQFVRLPSLDVCFITQAFLIQLRYRCWPDRAYIPVG